MPLTPAAAADRLIAAVQDLSLARTLDGVTYVVRQAARDLADADGATFVLLEGDRCRYADEDAIKPLWKGHSFPVSACVSGWVMLHRQPALIPDITADPRVPQDAYRPTFVRSMAMVPIRSLNPVGAVGVYWAQTHRPTPEVVRVVQALADSAAVALEVVQAPRESVRRSSEAARVCSWTRKLEWQGEWISLEDYLWLRFGVEVTHGVCPEALDRLHAEMLRVHRPNARASGVPGKSFLRDKLVDLEQQRDSVNPPTEMDPEP
jgi:hypothetical protein